MENKQIRLNINTIINGGETLLTYYCREGKIQYVKMILEDEDCDINCPDIQGLSPILKAALYNHFDIVEFLMDRPDCDINFVSKYKQISLCYIIFTSNVKCENIIEKLLQRKDCDLNIQDVYGNNILMRLCQMDNRKLVNRLLNTNRCDITLRNNNKLTASQLAMRNGLSFMQRKNNNRKNKI